MRFSPAALAAFVAIPAAVFAQNTIEVLVGDQGTLTYNPSNITANVGDKVAFKFLSKNHTVTQSTFADPCVPANFNGSAGANSGFLFVSPDTDLNNPPTWTITVNSTDPIWMHCGQTNPVSHCQMGMVFSINANDAKPFDTYLSNAKNSDPTAASSSDGSQGSSSVDGSQGSSSSVDGSQGSSSSVDGSQGSSSSVDGGLSPTSSSGAGAPPVSSAPPVPAPITSSGPVPAAAVSGSPAADQTQGGTSTNNKNAAARTGVSVRGLSGVVGAIVLGAVLI